MVRDGDVRRARLAAGASQAATLTLGSTTINGAGANSSVPIQVDVADGIESTSPSPTTRRWSRQEPRQSPA
ncbi:MAG: hypothetical protein U0802_14725 [Candidatus Binatia bacterium]